VAAVDMPSTPKTYPPSPKKLNLDKQGTTSSLPKSPVKPVARPPKPIPETKLKFMRTKRLTNE